MSVLTVNRWSRRLILLVALLLSACDEPLPPWVAEPGVRSTSDRPFWIDDKRVMFHRLLERPDGETRIFPAIWNTVTGEILSYGEDWRAWCVDPINGVAAFEVENNAAGNMIYRIGPVGEEKPIVPEELHEEPIWHGFNCRMPGKPEHLKGHILTSLLPGDGLLDLGKKGGPGFEKRPVYHLADGSRERTLMPFLVDQHHDSCLHYSATRKAYFITRCGAGRESLQGDCYQAWWLWPDSGRTERVCIPAGFKDSVILPSRLGWVVNHLNFGRYVRINDSGLYLVTDQGRRLLVTGNVGNAALSPDGCKVAFLRSPKQLGDKTLISIDLCEHHDAILALSAEPF